MKPQHARITQRAWRSLVSRHEKYRCTPQPYPAGNADSNGEVSAACYWRDEQLSRAERQESAPSIDSTRATVTPERSAGPRGILVTRFSPVLARVAITLSVGLSTG